MDVGVGVENLRFFPDFFGEIICEWWILHIELTSIRVGIYPRPKQEIDQLFNDKVSKEQQVYALMTILTDINLEPSINANLEKNGAKHNIT